MGGFRTEIKAGPHHLVADEPAGVGGTNTGPSPYGLLAAALASCTSMTLRMYASHKALDVERVAVRVRHRKVHADDCEDCRSGDGMIVEFFREVTIDGELTNDQRKRMLEIADRCPVHRTLEGEIKVRSNPG
jgi:putative redox protein